MNCVHFVGNIDLVGDVQKIQNCEMENLDIFVFILGTHMCVCVFSPSPQRKGSLILRSTRPLIIGFDILFQLSTSGGIE